MRFRRRSKPSDHFPRKTQGVVNAATRIWCPSLFRDLHPNTSGKGFVGHPTQRRRVLCHVYIWFIATASDKSLVSTDRKFNDWYTHVWMWAHKPDLFRMNRLRVDFIRLRYRGYYCETVAWGGLCSRTICELRNIFDTLLIQSKSVTEKADARMSCCGVRENLPSCSWAYCRNCIPGSAIQSTVDVEVWV